MGITPGMMLCGAPAPTEPRLVRELSPRRVLSACTGENQLSWENKCAGEKEGGSGVELPLERGVEQGWSRAGAVLQGSEGQHGCTDSYNPECPNPRCVSAPLQVPGDSGDTWLPPPTAGDHWLLTVSLTLEMQALSFS